MGDEAEAELGRLLGAGSFEAAGALAVESYGPELYGFLIHLLGGESDAAEVFSQTCEDLWSGISRFEGRASVRTWLYVLARHAASRFRRSPWNRAARRTGDSRLEQAVERTRSRTQPWLRTDVKDRFALLRESLDVDDRTLLVLRVDRDLSWEDVARVMLGEEAPETETLERECARLRKRYQLVKEDLRRRAREAGLLGER